jgi:two-component system, LytTR family, response regulator
METSTSEMAMGARRLVVKSADQVAFLTYDEIDWFESAGNYVRVHVGAEAYLMRETMKGIEARIDDRFLRVHRSAIVNTDRIKWISLDAEGMPTVVLRNGTRVAAGRYIESRLRRWMNKAQ